jgi:hypothetical protein
MAQRAGIAYLMVGGDQVPLRDNFTVSPVSPSAVEPSDVARAVAVKLNFDPARIGFVDDDRHVELDGRTYCYAASFDGGEIVLFGKRLTPETTTGIAAHAITHCKFKALMRRCRGRLDVGPHDGVTECSRRAWGAFRSRRIDVVGASVNQLAEMARIKVETSKLPGRRSWRELYRAMDRAFDPNAASG